VEKIIHAIPSDANAIPARIIKIAGVATAINSRAARHDADGTYCLPDPHGRHAAVEARVLDLVRRCEQFALAAWGCTFDVHVRLDDRKIRHARL
jgi:hypothetical protein